MSVSALGSGVYGQLWLRARGKISMDLRSELGSGCGRSFRSLSYGEIRIPWRCAVRHSGGRVLPSPLVTFPGLRIVPRFNGYPRGAVRWPKQEDRQLHNQIARMSTCLASTVSPGPNAMPPGVQRAKPMAQKTKHRPAGGFRASPGVRAPEKEAAQLLDRALKRLANDPDHGRRTRAREYLKLIQSRLKSPA